VLGEGDGDWLGDGEVVGVGVGVGDVEDVAVLTSSHCWMVPDVVVPAGVVPPPPRGIASEVAAMPKLAAETTRKPPAAMLIAGRTCAKRMKALPLLFVAPAKRVFSMDCLCRVPTVWLVRYVRMNVVAQLRRSRTAIRFHAFLPGSIGQKPTSN
jgi:hypothetical protein